MTNLLPTIQAQQEADAKRDRRTVIAIIAAGVVLGVIAWYVGGPW